VMTGLGGYFPSQVTGPIGDYEAVVDPLPCGSGSSTFAFLAFPRLVGEVDGEVVRPHSPSSEPAALAYVRFGDVALAGIVEEEDELTPCGVRFFSSGSFELTLRSSLGTCGRDASGCPVPP